MGSNEAVRSLPSTFSISAMKYVLILIYIKYRVKSKSGNDAEDNLISSAFLLCLLNCKYFLKGLVLKSYGIFSTRASKGIWMCKKRRRQYLYQKMMESHF